MSDKTVSERLLALEYAIAHQDHGQPAAYGVWHSAVASIRAEVERNAMPPAVRAVVEEIRTTLLTEWKDEATGVMRLRGVAWPHNLDTWIAALEAAYADTREEGK